MMMTRRNVLKGLAAAVAAVPVVRPGRGTAQVVRVRRDVTRLDEDDPFFANYALAIARMRELPDDDPRSWRNQAIIHADHCPHSPFRPGDFVQWHRLYLTYFERICGELIGDNSFALPYWNWSRNDGRLPAPFFGDSPLNVEFLNDPSDYTAPLSASTPWGSIMTTARSALSPTVGLRTDSIWSDVFSATRIDDIRRLDAFADFSSALEGTPHSIAHGVVGAGGGHMSWGLSPLDPVFWLHHCNVDRIWAEWQAATNFTPPSAEVYDGQFVDESGNSVRVTADESHNHVGLGFTYDTVTSLFTDAELGGDEEIANLIALEATLPDLRGDVAGAVENNPVSLGMVDDTRNAIVGVATNFAIQAPRVEEELFRPRTFRATRMLTRPRGAIESRRILAILRGVTYEQGERPLTVVGESVR